MNIATYKYRVKDKSQQNTLRELAWRCNQIWNFCTAFQRTCVNFWPSGFDFNQYSNDTRKQFNVMSDTKDEICRTFVQSRNTHKRYPKFRASGGLKRKLGWIPFHKRTVKIIDDTIKYQGRVYRFWKHRELPGPIKTGAFVEDSQGRWFVTFVVEVPDLPTGTGEIGIDLGLKNTAICSDGTVVNHVRFTQKYAEKLAINQRAHNKKRVKVIHTKIKNSRAHHLHVESAKIARENKVIVVGDVSSSKLAKTKMAKSVLDVSWYMFKTMLEYKASRHNATFKVVNEAWTTQTCSACGSRTSEQRPKGIAGLGIRDWECDCGVLHNRDQNAALNILALGLEHKPLVGESLLL